MWPESICKLHLIFAALYSEKAFKFFLPTASQSLIVLKSIVSEAERLSGFVMLMKWNVASLEIMVRFFPDFPS